MVPPYNNWPSFKRTLRSCTTRRGLLTVALIVLLLSLSLETQAQTKSKTAKLPSAAKVVENYLKAIGGKKHAAAVRDAIYEWTIQLDNQPIGVARTLLKAPASRRWELKFGNGQIISGTSPGSAWTQGLDNRLVTLTGDEAANAKVQAVLEASHLVDFKKHVLARVISLGDLASEPAYIVEFSTRGGARLRYWFSTSSNLLVKIEDEARRTTTRLTDYKVSNSQTGLLEPHTATLKTGDGELTFKLERVTYNSNLINSTFDPPSASESLDVVGLLREVAKNQEVLESRVSEYSFMQKETDREINDKGELKKEKTRVYEVFPVAHRQAIMKLISENGVALSGERAAKEEKRVAEEFEKAEREREKDKEKFERQRAERLRKRASQGESDDDDPTISQFLKACEFVSPRRERRGDREGVVFDFRPRPGFRPSNRAESLISKLVGVAWIDPIDKQVIRLEARLAESFKMAGGLVLSLRPGAAMSMEQTRMTEGVWLPRFAQVNLSVKVFVFRGVDVNKTIEWSDYKHFKGDVTDYKLENPKVERSEAKP